ncbi:DNA-binding helix-turn-helix protein [Necator americanus]|uniref:DNA-binding helix-turn-helix protein n=1 Tax=Necator americanus TaxID=51031 RepID=W2TKG5_NECAM|nr:DNA-binding helix-turn-helix protein [Necator americanus]ETN82119.1 DNA-binding helix-turn-helix protein [Necator americanus]
MSITIFRTSVYLRFVSKLPPGVDIDKAEEEITKDPNGWPVIQGTDGIRKARFAIGNKGKRGAMREVLNHVQGKIILESREIEVSPPEVRTIRQKYALSQQDFARLFGISVRTLQKWEQGSRSPQGAAKVLLNVIAKNPQAVWDVLH